MSYSSVATSTPLARAADSVRPTEATCGSVKTTGGDHVVVGEVAVARTVGRAPLGAGRDHVAGDPSVVLAHVGEQGSPADVAHRVQPAAATDHRHMVVGVDVTMLVRGDSDSLEAEVSGGRDSAGGDDDLVDLERRLTCFDRRRAAMNPAESCVPHLGTVNRLAASCRGARRFRAVRTARP